MNQIRLLLPSRKNIIKQPLLRHKHRAHRRSTRMGEGENPVKAGPDVV